MILALLFLIVFCANLWLGWALGSWIGIGVFLGFIPVSIFLTLGGAIALGLVGMIFSKHDDRTQIRRFFRHFLRGWGWLILLLWISPWMMFGLVKFSNNVAPATLPKITISNGEKTVIFQSMMHIGSPEFYENIQQDMEGLRGRDFVFFYEGVKPGTQASLEKLSELIGMNISEEMYDIFAEMGGLIKQNPENFLGIIPSTNIDLSTDEIIALAGNTDIITPVNKPEQSIIRILEEQYPTFTVFQKSITRVMARGMLNMLLRIYTDPMIETKLKESLPIFEVLLDKRNTLLVDAIQASPAPNIYIHYGALHYPGVLASLQEKDPRWQEIARTYFVVIR